MEPLNVWSYVITGTILAKADGSESYLQLLFCATQCLSGIEIRQRCRLRHHFSPVFPQGDCDDSSQLWPVELWYHLMWWYSAQFHCCNMSRLINGTLNSYGFYLCVRRSLLRISPAHHQSTLRDLSLWFLIILIILVLLN